ncbi:MAG: hypothetical protein AAFY29_07540 [Pseudomonadota bacterium]
MKRVAYFLVAVLLLNFSWALLNPAAARSQFVPLSPLFTEMSPGVFVESGPVSEADIAARLDRARQRVNDWFGSSSATPNIIVAQSETVAKRYGNVFGAMHGSPLRGGTVMIGPVGLSSVDVIAHELAHAEHLSRAGYLRWTLTPAWFIEGLGMQVDWRDAFRSEAPADLQKSLPRVRQWFSFREFAQDNLREHYRSSAQTVRSLDQVLGRDALLELATGFPLYRSFDRSLELALAENCGDCDLP